jgi:hypothetical protein
VLSTSFRVPAEAIVLNPMLDIAPESGDSGRRSGYDPHPAGEPRPLQPLNGRLQSFPIPADSQQDAPLTLLGESILEQL